MLLGILSAVALSRYTDLTDEAELAQAQGVATAMQSAVNRVQLTWLLKSFPSRVQDLEGFGNNDVDTNNSGYPIGTNKGNGNENIGRNNAGCTMLWEGLMSVYPSVSLSNDGSDYQAYRHSGNRQCGYVYRAGGDTRNRTSADLVINYNSTTGVVSVCGSNMALAAC